jgi:hypothetical protein
MRATRGYDTFEEFEREELCAKRNNAWTIAELVDDFTIVEELDLELIEGDREEEPSDDEDD